jgi:hypothetical protein
LLWLAGNALPAPVRLRGRSGASGAPTNCGCGTPPSSRPARHRSTPTGSSIWCPGNGITVTLTPEPNSTSARVLFLKALEAENLLTDEIRHRLTNLDDDQEIPVIDDDTVPLLLAISDNGTEMKAADTRRFMALCSIAQHFGRPSTPTDQAWIESLWGHTKRENPHLLTITDPAVLVAELERVRVHYNTIRLHEAIGYVTPDDEHQGQGDTIRQARRDGLTAADQARRAWHRTHPTTT